VAEVRSKWFCVACMKSLVQDGDAQSDACPQGHRIDDPELTAPAATGPVADA
jgi:hypothetical protein